MLLKEDCLPFDIGSIVYRVTALFTNAEKFWFIESVWKPDLLFKIPASKETSGKQWNFWQEWLMKYPWLLYSSYLDGTLCLPWVCFRMECGKNGAKLDKLFNHQSYFGWRHVEGSTAMRKNIERSLLISTRRFSINLNFSATTSNAIKELINSVCDLGLTMDNCRGQSYDGARNMAYRYIGVSTSIQHQFSKAIYVHCIQVNHRLNLCVAEKNLWENSLKINLQSKHNLICHVAKMKAAKSVPYMADITLF